jgi:hypothetical protein
LSDIPELQLAADADNAGPESEGTVELSAVAEDITPAAEAGESDNIATIH